MEIFRANYQWANRPEDERFTSLQAMRDQCREYADHAREAEIGWKDLRVEKVGDDLQLIGQTGVAAAVSHYAFGQLAERAKAPASYIRTLPATLAAQNINHGLAKRSDDATARLLFHDRNGSGLLLRAATGDIYERIWNWEVLDRLLGMEADGWQAATPDMVWPDLPHSADPDLYASDHDMFAFVRHPDRAIDDGSEHGLRRGIIVSNSEVGDASLSATYFLYRYQCGNHIIWGAQDVKDVRVAHRGESAREKFSGYLATLTEYVNGAASDEEAQIAKARETVIAKDKAAVLDVLFGKRALGLSRKQLEAGYDATQPDVDGDPVTVWGFVQGLTRHSQTVPYADERTTLDRAAGKVMRIAF